MISIPRRGRTHDDILQEMAAFKQKDADYLGGRTWSLVYHHSDAHDQFLKKAHNLFFCENALNPMAFRSLKRFEHEVIQMAARLLNGDDRVTGTLTSGGTESCLLPVLACRERAAAKKRWTRFTPEMIAPESIHVAWDKAARYFNVKMVKIPLTRDLTMDLGCLQKKINRNTIMIVASAPSYPHGVIDPVADIGRLAAQKKIPFHVDACLGGFFLPFMEAAGHPVPRFDFRCPGVTSMSADVHKYGFGAKGASVVLYKDISYLKHQFFIHTDWPGGVFASPALLGTRPGGPIAAAWAAVNAMGMEGYKTMAAGVMQTTRQIMSGIRSVKGLKILGKPQMSVFAYTAADKNINIFAVADLMEEKGWHIDRLQKPRGLHAMVTPAHEQVAGQYLEDLNESVAAARANPDLAAKGNAAMYGMMATVPFRGMIRKEVMKMMENMYGPACTMPLDSPETVPWTVRLGSRILKWLKIN